MPYIRKGEAIDPTWFLNKVELTPLRKDKIVIDGDLIKLGSDRYKCFKNSGLVCTSCGIVGDRFFKEKHKNEEREVYHLNLYATDGLGAEVMMTKDHVIPVSKGGTNHYNNYVTMCIVCNSEKGNMII
jgi:5-methylcytosine-specific restriction endonuclease McrA